MGMNSAPKPRPTSSTRIFPVLMTTDSAPNVEGYSAIFDLDDTIGLLGYAPIVRYHDDSCAQGLVYVARNPIYALGRIGIKIAGRLIGQYDGGAVDECARDGRPLIRYGMSTFSRAVNSGSR